MSERIYSTQEYKGYGKQNYYRYQYELDGDEVTKIKSHRQKFFDGDENVWDTDETVVNSWNVDDSDLPDWLHNYL